MNRHSHILVPYDASGSAMVALETAEMIASKTGASLTLLYINDLHRKEIPDNISLSLYQTVDRIRGQYGLNCDFLVRPGKVHKEIVKTASQIDTDLIIMGTHGKNGFAELFHGSVAYKVATNAPCPVITVKEHIRHHEMRNIVLPIDSARDTRQKVPQAAVIAELMDAIVHVLVIAEKDPAEFRRIRSYGIQVQNYLEDEGITTTLEVIRDDKNEYRTITDYAQKVSADLIMVGTNGDSESIFSGPTAQQMIHHSPFPVMSVKHKDVGISYASL